MKKKYKITWKHWGYIGIVMFIIGFVFPIFLKGAVISLFIMSFYYWKDRKKEPSKNQ